MPRAPGQIEKIKSLANSILQYADQCQYEEDFSISEQGKQISAACSELASLAATPRNWVIQVACAYSGSMALSIVLELGLQKCVGTGETATSLDNLAQTTHAPKQIIKSAMRQCVLSHIFEEPTPENYRHNDNSRTLLNEDYASWVHFRADDGLLSGAYLTRSIVANNLQIPSEPHKMAFGLAFQTDKQFYEYYSSVDQGRGARFAKAMAASTENGKYGVPLELEFFEKLKKDATIVDVGGGRGQNSIRLANHFPEMSFIVQDRYSNADSENWSHLPANIRDRIKWQAHDFYTPEPVEGADVYMISQVLMDHQPSACREIIKHVVEAMVPNHSILLISDYMSPGSEGNFSRMINALNLHMMSVLGRAFYTRTEWEELFASVSPLLKLQILAFTDGRAILELILQSQSLSEDS